MISKRAEYWNAAYAEYWLKRVKEAETGLVESSIQAGDKVTEGDQVYFDIFKEHNLNPGNILDVGCGWGRFFPFFAQQGVRVFGIDISISMVQMFNGDEIIKEQFVPPMVAEAEHLPFPNAYFDNVACLAVFDATDQDISLTEFLRVLKPNGQLYLTGKNINYFENDDLALEAEIGAAEKGHPNYFTDLKAVVENLTSNGHSIVAQYLFPRRGDFAKRSFHEDLNEKFYEFCIVVRKSKEGSLGFEKPISSAVSFVRAKTRNQ